MSVLNNRYQLETQIGKGGMGVVYHARDTQTNKFCAVKELHFEAFPEQGDERTRLHATNAETRAHASRQAPLTREEAIQKFLAEAEILKQLSHPNLPKVIDSFGLDGKYYLVMELIEGQNLEDLMTARQFLPVPEAQARAWIEQVMSALGHCHSHSPKVIHRDVKPANVIVTPQGKAYLVDFGIAKIGDTSRRTELAGQAITKGYSPLEQYGKRGRTDERSDIYSLGATAYFLLTGHEPVEATDRAADPDNEMPSPRALRPDLSPLIDFVVMRAMAMKPDNRFASVSDMQQGLSGRPTSRVSSPNGISSVNKAPVSLSRKLFIVTASLLVLASSGVVGIIMLSSPSSIDPRLTPRATNPPASNEPIKSSVMTGNSATPTTPMIITPTPNANETAASAIVKTQTTVAQQAVSNAINVTAQALAVTQTALARSLATLTPTSTPTIAINKIFIPPGAFIQGSSLAELRSEVIPLCETYKGLSSEINHSCKLSSFQRELISNEVPEPNRNARYYSSRSKEVAAFYIDKTEVTNAQYQECERANRCDSPASSGNLRRRNYDDPTYRDHPVTFVTYDQAKRYCNYVNGRLPRSFEWEKAARGTDGRIWPWGNATSDLYVSANIRPPGSEIADQDGGGSRLIARGTKPVGGYSSDRSPYGVMDMVGNVAEWVDGDVVTGDIEIRGGSWNMQAYSGRAAARVVLDSAVGYRGYFDIGFRCAYDR